MSNIQTTKYLEDVQERFEELVAEGDWNGVNELQLELQEGGFSQEEIELINSMSEEDLLSYKRWDRQTNGSIETQMDDFSDNL
jgi:hypothetical protein